MIRDRAADRLGNSQLKKEAALNRRFSLCRRSNPNIISVAKRSFDAEVACQ